MRCDTGRLQRRLCGLTALAAVGGAVLPGVAAAQAAPPVPQAADPPARVGRLSRVSGAVSFRAQDSDPWGPAVLNYPLTTANALQVAPQGRAGLQIDADRFALPGPAEVVVTRLDDSVLAATLPQGEVCFTLAPMPPGRSDSVLTPRGLVQIATGGRYAVTAGDSAHPTIVAVLAGAAEVTVAGAPVALAAGQAATLTGPGADQAQATVGPAAADQCLTDLLAAEAPPRVASPPPPAEVLQMTGGAALAGYGVWQPEPDTGSVWFPQVEAGWVPYRHGRWIDVPPWGWTWVDDAPWGFAPFHYGRWAQFHGRWGWAPGREDAGRPVYAPALVTFFGLAAAAGSVGWVPLAPHEPYYPWYHASAGYVRQINMRHVTNITNVVNTYTSTTYHDAGLNRSANAAAASLVPAAAMARSQRVAELARPVEPQQLAAAQPVARAFAHMPAADPAAFHLPQPEHAGAPLHPVQTQPAAAAPTLRRPEAARPEVSAPAVPRAVPQPAVRPAEPAHPELHRLAEPARPAGPEAHAAQPHVPQVHAPEVHAPAIHVPERPTAPSAPAHEAPRPPERPAAPPHLEIRRPPEAARPAAPQPRPEERKLPPP